jgi:hypothetical protein
MRGLIQVLMDSFLKPIPVLLLVTYVKNYILGFFLNLEIYCYLILEKMLSEQTDKWDFMMELKIA